MILLNIGISVFLVMNDIKNESGYENKPLRFYKENDKWYADVPGVSKEDNEMVFGSDIFLGEK